MKSLPRLLAIILLTVPGSPAPEWPTSPPLPLPVITGEVRDAQGPVACARVRIQGQRDSVQTDRTGHFQLPPVHPPGRVTAWKEGYLIAGASGASSPLVLNLQRLPAEDAEGYDWVAPQRTRTGRRTAGIATARFTRSGPRAATPARPATGVS
jgi:hypothetical protein